MKPLRKLCSRMTLLLWRFCCITEVLCKKLAGQEIVKENGQRCRSFDEEMLLRLEVKLMTSISKFKFLPEEESV